MPSIEIGDELCDVDCFGFSHGSDDGVGNVIFNDAVPFGKALVLKALFKNGSDCLAPSFQIGRD